MSLILSKKYSGENGLKLFYSNRFLRLFPTYWIIFLMTLGISLLSGIITTNWLKFTSYIEWFSTINPKTFFILGLTNITLVGQDVMMFLGMDRQSGLLFFTSNFQTTDPRVHEFLFVPQAWSISIEIMFYAIAPFLARQKNRTLIVLTMISLGLRGFIYWGLGWHYDPWTYRFFPTELGLFLLGMLSYRFYDILTLVKVWEKSGRYFFVAFVGFTLLYQFLPDAVIMNWLYVFTGAICLPFIFHHTKNNRLDRWLGDFSYPIYTVHVLVTAIVLEIINLHKDYFFLGLIVAIISFLISFALIKLLAPLETIRQTRSQGLEHSSKSQLITQGE